MNFTSGFFVSFNNHVAIGFRLHKCGVSRGLRANLTNHWGEHSDSVVGENQTSVS